MGTVVQPAPPASHCGRGGGADRRELVVSEVAGDEVTTNMTTVPRRTQQCKRQGRRSSRASWPVAMAARWHGSP